MTHTKARPRKLAGQTYRAESPLGTAFVTVNEHDGQPFEVFVNVGKAGSDTAAVAEAFGRLISLVLRLPPKATPEERLSMALDQLAGIGGARHLGFGKERVKSLPDAIAKVLEQYIGGRFIRQELAKGDENVVPCEDLPNTSASWPVDTSSGVVAPDPAFVVEEVRALAREQAAEREEKARQVLLHGGQVLGVKSVVTEDYVRNTYGELCPKCGNATLFREEGCMKCQSCGYSEC